MNKKYLLIGGIAIFAAWWFFFRNTETEEADTADDQPEGNEEADEEESSARYAPRNNNGTGITATSRIPVNKTGTGNRSNTGRGNGRITYEPTYQHFEGKIYTPNN